MIEPPSKGAHIGVLCEVVDQGVQDTPFGPKPKGLMIFQVDEKDSSGKPKEVWHYINNMTLGSATKPSNLREFLQEWLGRPLTKSEASGFELADLVGKSAELLVKLAPTKKDPTKLRAEIAGISESDEQLSIEGYTPYHERKSVQAAAEADAEYAFA